MSSTRFAVRGLAVATALSLALAACGDTVVERDENITVTVAPSNPTIEVGGTVQLSAAVNGSSNQSVTWSSDNQQIATVSTSGLVTGVAAGQVAIRATSVADPSAIGFASVTVNPPPAITVTVTPSQFDLAVGGTRQLAAQVSGTANQNVTWSSDNTSVATVSATGLVTGVSDGTTIIRATSAANPQAVGTAAVTVSRISGEIVIQRITAGNTNIPVNPNAIAGQIDVTVEFSAPQGSGVTGVEVLVDDQVICSQSVSDANPGDEAGALATTVCPVITNAFDATTGTPDFPNGQYTIGARLVTSAGAVNAEAGQQVTFANNDVWVLSVTTSGGEAFDNGGLLWTAGSVTITGLPVLYSGREIERVSFTLPIGGGLTRTDTDGSDGWSVTFATSGAAPNVAGVNTGALGVNPQVNASVYVGGQPGPVAVAATSVNGTAGVPLRLDNQAPNGGNFVITDQGNIGTAPGFRACCSNNWVGASTTFASFHPANTMSDNNGVGGLEVTYFAGPADDTDAELMSGSPVTSGADLAGTTLNSAYRAIAVVKDALGNQTIVRLQESGANPVTVAVTGPADNVAAFGVDKIAPEAEIDDANSLADESIFNIANPVAGDQFIVAFSDQGGTDGGPSGFSGNPVLVLLTRQAPPSTNACEAPSTPINNVCRAQFAPGNTAQPNANDGEYTYEAVVYDQAGNASAPVTIKSLVDGTAPVVNNVTIPAVLEGGKTAQFGVTATDNIDLGDAQFFLVFNGGTMLPVVASQALGTAFDGTFTTSGNASASFLFIRAIEDVNGANAPAGVAAEVANGASYIVADAAGNTAQNTTNFNPLAGFTSATARNVAAFVVASSEADLCNGDNSGPCTDADDDQATSTTITITATGPSGTFDNPFQGGMIYVFRLDNAGDYHLVGTITGSNGQVTDSGATRTWRWTTAFDAAGLAADANNQIVVIGVDAEGDGLRTSVLVPILPGN